ncbi:MAG: hypothetical protein K0R65_1386 [Crocinitomicaceae bacterium]|nr:hypothetical protein [Crocinitomicaceae bacterium]
MKKSYLLVLGLGISLVSFGQKKIVEKKPAYKGLSVDVTSEKIKSPKKFSKAAGDVFFHQEFNGSIDDWTTSGQDAAIWLFDTDGPSGQYAATNNSDIITSTSAANGFMIFDADAADIVAPYEDKQGSLVSPIIDLTGRPSVSIRFQHAYRTCCLASFYPKLEVTTDGFATVTEYNVTETGIGVNDLSGTAVKEVNIDAFLATAGDVSQFQFRFNFDGVTNSSSHYYWQIDDVELFEPYMYSLEAVLPYWGSTGYWELRLPYSMVPQDQVAPIDYSYLVENKGSVTQTDVVLETTIPEASFTNTGAMSTIPAFSIDTTDASASFTPDGSITTYNPTFVVTSSNEDVDPSDNVGTAPAVTITDTVYARDMGTVDGGSYNQGEGFEVGNIFDTYAEGLTASASVWVRSTSNPGASIYVRLYSIDPETGDFVFVTESDAHTVTDDELGTLVTLMYQDVATLTADNSYLVVAGSFGDGGSTDDLIVGTSGVSEPQTTYYFDMTDQTWYYTTNTPIVRLNYHDPQSVSVNELKSASGLSVYPNPAKDKVSVNFNVSKEAAVKIELTDLAGKVVSSKTMTASEGAHSVELETRNVSNGVYVLNLVTEGEISSHKVVISH